ncbi:hypothetical protein IU402_08140 [Aerococcaceae bacterium zg-BR9]|uniref:hypothetical protein n=1 Tax=Aerococcaceae bacterium zg-1292 TaxID=2774330 RepID=UPI0040634432|nr:hypothetical protein [Aerococcaceae bacterium zg-BR9]
MSIVTIISEFTRFIKDYLLKILLGAVLISIACMGFKYYSESMPKEETAAYQDLKERYAQEPAEVHFIVSKEDGTFFNNSFVFDEYFSLPEIISAVEKESGVSFAQFKKSENTLLFEKTSSFRGGISAWRNPSTDVLTLRVLAGKTAEENLAIAKAYQKLLEKGDFPFLLNNKITVISGATIGEQLPLTTFPYLTSVESLKTVYTLNKRSIIIIGLAGFIGGAILMTGALFFLRLFKKKITYAFDYSWAMDDDHLLYQRDMSDNIIVQDMIQTPSLAHRYVIMQMNPEKILPVADQTGLIHVTRVQDIIEPVEEIVIVLYANQSDKAWFNAQYTLARLYKVPVKIIHII